MISAILVAASYGLFAMQPPDRQPPRDTRPPTSASTTASISGTVSSDDAQPRTLRRVRVTLNGAAMESGGRTVITDDEGRYEFSRLPPGQYGLAAVKDGWVAARYGSDRPPHLASLRTVPATGVSLRAGDRITADFRLARGAVITGVVADTDGRPEEGVLVAVYAYQRPSGVPDRRLSVVSSYLRTDDRGVYRIYGLRAGEYVVGAQRGSSGAEPSLRPSTTDGRSVVATPIYFPSTTDMTAATTIKVAAGEERTGVDIQMRYVPAATVAGIVALPPGTIFARVMLTRATGRTGALETVAGTTTQPDGTFVLVNVTPGHYTLFAIAQGPSTAAQGTPVSGAGAIDMDVDGEDATGVTIPMSPPFSLSGTLVFDGTGPPDVRTGSMTLPIAPNGNSIGPSPFFRSLDESHFTISGLFPGTYRVIGATVPGLRVPVGRWWLKSITVGGREVLDGPVEIRQSGDERVIVTVADRASAVAGTVRDAHGSAVPNASVVIFATDRESWFFNSRRIASVRTDGQGRYTVHNLPPGQYRAAIALDIEPDEWFDVDVLQSLSPGAVGLTISGTEAKTLDLVLR